MYLPPVSTQRQKRAGNKAYDKGIVVVLELFKAAIGCVGCHCQTKTPFVFRSRVTLKECGGHEGLQDEEPCEANAKIVTGVRLA